jgi:hypothetical protein
VPVDHRGKESGTCVQKQFAPLSFQPVERVGAGGAVLRLKGTDIISMLIDTSGCRDCRAKRQIRDAKNFGSLCRRSQRPVAIPDAIGEQAIQVGKVRVTVDEEVQAFAIVLARPLAVPRLPPRIVGGEVQAPKRLTAAMVTAFDVASRAMVFAGTGFVFILARLLMPQSLTVVYPVACFR